MLGTRAVFAPAALLALVTLSPVSGLQIPPPDSCPWCVSIDGAVQTLQQQIAQLRNWLNLHPSDDPFSIGVSTSEPTQVYTSDYNSIPDSTPRVSITFGLPSAPTDQIPLVVPTPAQVPTSVPDNPVLPLPPADMGGGEGFRSVAYFVNWGIYGRKYFPQNIPADKLTHVLYSFGDNREDGEVILTDQWSDIQIHYDGDSWNDQGNNLYGNLKQLYLLKQKNRNLKVLLSIGGWTYAHEQKHFDTPASTDQGRKTFAASCVKLIKDLGFDGIDIDWEYPRDQDQGNQLLLLLQEIRSAMDAYATKLEGETGTKPQFVLTIAAPAGADNYNHLPLADLAKVLDFINLMAYDYSGSWDKAAGHQANLFPSSSCPACTPFNSQSVIDAYISKGVPANKIVLGMPLYGRAFTDTDGIGKPYNGSGPGSWENGVWDFKALPQPGAQELYDEEAGATYSYDQNSRTLVSYDTLDMAKKKAQWIKQKGLGGAMWWELSGDRQGEGSIVEGVVAELGGPSNGRLEQRPNWLTYSESQYDNLRKGYSDN